MAEEAEPIKVIILARVSTTDQKTIPAQVDEIKKVVERRGETILKVIEETRSVTAREEDLEFKQYINHIPALKEILELAKHKLFQKLYCWKWDRIARDISFLENFIKQLHYYGISSESIIEGVDPLVRRLYGVIAQQESETKSQRVKLTKKRLFEQEYHHTGFAPFGYKLSKKIYKKILLVDKKKAPFVKRFFELYAELRLKGKARSESGIGEFLGRTQCWNMLQNKSYAGWIQYKGLWKKGRHEPIISEELFNKVQQVLKETYKPFNKHPRVVAKLIQERERVHNMLEKKNRGVFYVDMEGSG